MTGSEARHPMFMRMSKNLNYNTRFIVYHAKKFAKNDEITP